MLTRMRSDRARCKSQRWFSGSYFSKLIPESSESPVPIFGKAHPKTLRTSVFLSLSPEIPSANPHRAKAKGRFNDRVQTCSTVVFAVKPPFYFYFMRNYERNVCFGKAEIIRSFSRMEYTGDMGCGILVTWRNLPEKQRIWSLMLRPEMNLPERSEFSSQALLLSDFRPFIFLRFRNGIRIPHPISPSHSIREILNIFHYFLI